MAVAKKKSKPSTSARKPLSRKSPPSAVKPVSQRFAAVGEKLSPRLQDLIDTREIEQMLATFARGLDRLEENTLRSAMHADATFDLGPGMFQGVASDYVGWALGMLQNVKSSHHLLGQTRVELSGDEASVETYFHAHFRVEKPIGREDVFWGGRFVDRVERRPAGSGGLWKIAHRKQVLDWVRTEAVSDIFYMQNPDALWSNRSKADPSLQMAQFPGSGQKGGKLPSFAGRRYESRSVKF